MIDSQPVIRIGRIFAVTTYGLENISAREMASLPGMTDIQVTYRRITAVYDGPPALLLDLRTVEDVFLDIGTWHGVGRNRSALATLCSASVTLDLHKAVALCTGLRPVAASPSFSVTASFVGKRNYTTEEIKCAVAEGIEQGTGYSYCNNERLSDLNVRVFIEHDRAFIGVRLAQRPLHERAYKRIHIAGSLKPSVAAALVKLAGVTRGMYVLDPCCGAGTIVIEAGLLGAEAYGGDNDPVALDAARMNASAAGICTSFRLWDARVLPLPNASVDRVITNLPWGRQVQVNSTLTAFYTDAAREMRRVLSPRGYIVALTNMPELLSERDLEVIERLEISLFGQRPTILVLAAKGLTAKH